MDLKLPQELWCQVFEYVSSLSHKFKLAGVNRRFRRCITTIMEKPMGLEIDFSETKSGRVRLNGCAVRLDCHVALQVLAEITQFVSINIVGRWFFGIRDDGQFLEKIFTILIEADCLSEVTSLKTQSLFCCDPNVWCGFLARCAKLQVLDVGSEFLTRWPPANLAVALTKKPLTELSLTLCMYNQAMLLQLLQSPVRHKLRKMHLVLFRTVGVWDSAQLVSQLVGMGVWSHLEEIIIDWEPRMGQLVDNEQLFGALVSSLPKLTRCHFVTFFDVNALYQTVPAILSVLNESDRSTKLSMVLKSHVSGQGIGCIMVRMIRQLQHHHPELQFDFDQDLCLSFELGNVSLCVQMWGYRKCRDLNCINNNQCHSFYPIVLDRIGEAAYGRRSRPRHRIGDAGHVENYRLDRCRIGRVAVDLKNWTRGPIEVTEVNQDQDLVTLTTVSNSGNPFNITVASGPCFFNPCIGCLIID